MSFGRVLIDEPIEETISFNNPTGEILEVEDVQLTPPLKAYDITRRIEPGGEARFRLVMGMDRKPGDFKGMIRILFSNGGFPSVTFAVEGTIAPPVEFEPMPAFFIATHSGNENSGSIKITVNRVQPLAIITATSNSDRFSIDLVPLEPGKHYRLDLTLDGNAAPGSKSEEILLKTNPPLEEPLIVQANTLIREPVYHFPDSIDMGKLPLKAAKNKVVNGLSQLKIA